MKEYKITNQKHSAIIRIKAENENIVKDILNNILNEVGISNVIKEGWEINLVL